MKGISMKRNTINFWIDLLAVIVLFAEIWTGLLIHYILPPGQGRGRSLELWGLNRHQYGTIHFYLAIAMITLIIIHIWLHWPWVCNTISDLFKARKLKPSLCSLYGVMALIFFFLLTVISLLLIRTQVVNVG
jgi:hypothetical protein